MESIRKLKWRFPTLVVLAAFALLSAACITLKDESTTQPPQASGPAATQLQPTPLALRELRVFVEPRNCTSYILDPQPVEGSRYRHGTFDIVLAKS